MFQSLAKGMQPFVKMMLSLDMPTHEPGGERTDESIALCQFDETVAQQHRPEGQNAGTAVLDCGTTPAGKQALAKTCPS